MSRTSVPANQNAATPQRSSRRVNTILALTACGALPLLRQTPLAAEVSLGSWPCQNAGALQIRRTIFLSTPKCPRERWQGGPEFAGAARTRFPSVNATVRVFTRPGSTTDQNESHNKGRRRSPLTSRSAVIGMRAKASWPPLNALSWACLRAPSFDVALARLVVVRIRGRYSWSAQILVGVVSV
jgi:hypothetical protein